MKMVRRGRKVSKLHRHPRHVCLQPGQAHIRRKKRDPTIVLGHQFTKFPFLPSFSAPLVPSFSLQSPCNLIAINRRHHFRGAQAANLPYDLLRLITAALSNVSPFMHAMSFSFIISTPRLHSSLSTASLFTSHPTVLHFTTKFNKSVFRVLAMMCSSPLLNIVHLISLPYNPRIG
jgi:hypothetical protein